MKAAFKTIESLFTQHRLECVQCRNQIRKTLQLLLLILPLATNALQLSDSSVISLLTVAPGNELYSTFGHSGVRVKDYKRNIDVVFNYGTFDFNQPDFYVNFLRGKMLYMLDVGSFENFMAMYEYEERSVEEDVLNLTEIEKQNIFDFLLNNAQPDNRSYRYDFFFDNCATRIRDVFEKELRNNIEYSYNGLDTTKTLRQMLDIYVEQSPWVKFGFYLILGLPCDVQAGARRLMFLPDYLQKTFELASVKTGNGSEPFVIKKQMLLQYPPPKKNNNFFSPKICMILLLLVAILVALAELAMKKHFALFDFVIFLSAGLLGTFFFSMWLFTEHYSVKKNLNLLWAIPLFLPLSFTLLFKKLKSFNILWLTATWIWMLVLLPVKLLLPQPLHGAVPVIIILMAFRAWYAAKMMNKKTTL